MKSRTAIWFSQLFYFVQEMGTLPEEHPNCAHQNAWPREHMDVLCAQDDNMHSSPYTHVCAQDDTICIARHLHIIQTACVKEASSSNVQEGARFATSCSGFIFLKFHAFALDTQTNTLSLNDSWVPPFGSYGSFTSPRKWARRQKSIPIFGAKTLNLESTWMHI